MSELRRRGGWRRGKCFPFWPSLGKRPRSYVTGFSEQHEKVSMATLASSYLLTENLVTTGAKGEDTRAASRSPLEVKIRQMSIQLRGFRTTSMTEKPEMSLVPWADAEASDGRQLSHSHMEARLNQTNAVALFLPPSSPLSCSWHL